MRRTPYESAAAPTSHSATDPAEFNIVCRTKPDLPNQTDSNTALLSYLTHQLQYRSKVSYHRLARRVSRETRRVSFLASALEVPMLRIHWYLKPVLLIRRLYRIVSISAVDTIFILISNACVPCVYYKFSSVQYCFIYIDQTFFYSSQTCLTFSFCKYMHDKS